MVVKADIAIMSSIGLSRSDFGRFMVALSPIEKNGIPRARSQLRSKFVIATLVRFECLDQCKAPSLELVRIVLQMQGSFGVLTGLMRKKMVHAIDPVFHFTFTARARVQRAVVGTTPYAAECGIPGGLLA